ncbi:FAD-dependent oxidoreductase [Sphingomonas oryzagri]
MRPPGLARNLMNAGRGTRRIVIVGAGFGGMGAAKALRRADAEIVLIEGPGARLLRKAAGRLPQPNRGNLDPIVSEQAPGN